MAFGDLIKSDITIADTTTITGNLGSNPASGNLLVFTIGAGITSVTLDTPPADFTLRRSSTSGSGQWWVYDKVSDGTEQSRSATFSTSTDLGVHYAEYDMQGETIDVRTLAENTDNISSNTNSQPSGSVTPTSAKNIVLTFHGTDDGIKSDGGQAVDGSWVEDTAFQGLGGGNNAEVKISRLVDVSGAQEATHSDTDTGDQMYGAAISYDMTVGGDISAILNAAFSNVSALTGRGDLALVESILFDRVASLTGRGDLALVESILFDRVAVLIGKGLLAVAESIPFSSVADLTSAEGDISAVLSAAFSSVPGLTGRGDLTSIESIDFSSILGLTGRGTLALIESMDFAGTHVLSVVDTQIQDQFRFGIDDGNEAGHGWFAAQNVNIEQSGDTSSILRIQVNNFGDFPTQQMKLQVKQTGDSDSNYRDVPVAP